MKRCHPLRLHPLASFAVAGAAARHGKEDGVARARHCRGRIRIDLRHEVHELRKQAVRESAARPAMAKVTVSESFAALPFHLFKFGLLFGSEKGFELGIEAGHALVNFLHAVPVNGLHVFGVFFDEGIDFFALVFGEIEFGMEPVAHVG